MGFGTDAAIGEVRQGNEKVDFVHKTQGCNVQHREYNQYFIIITLNGV